MAERGRMFLGKFSRDVAIDLGTSNTLVFVQGEGIVVNEPSIVSIREDDRSILAVGNEAKAMIGRTPPEIRVIQPLKNGVIADIGGGTTEVAVISLAGVIFCTSVRVAGDEMDEAVLQHIKKQYNLLIGERQAEELKLTLGSACPGEGPVRSVEVKGRDLADGI